MNKLNVSVTLLCLLFSFTVYGQYQDFDLSRYKLPDIKTNRLDFDFNLNNNMDNNLRQINSVEDKSKHNSLAGTMDLTYYNFRNTQKYQGDHSASLGLNPVFAKENENDLITNSREFNGRLFLSSNNRFFNQNMYFIEVDPIVSLRSDNSKQINDLDLNTTLEDKQNQLSTYVSVPVSIGHGRIEPVEDLRLAIYILEELSKAGVIATLPSDEIVLKLAEEISKIKKERFFDSRLKKIRELQVIDSFLVANGIISKNDINYFSVLNDNWDYAAGPQRESGFAVNAGIDNSVSFNKNDIEHLNNGGVVTSSTSKRNVYEVGGFFKLRYAKPVNLSWQTSTNIQASYMLEYTRDPDNSASGIANYNANILGANIEYSLQYLPNSRTSAELNMNASYQNSVSDRTRLDGTDYHFTSSQLAINPGLEMYYYVSPQLRVQLNATMSLVNINSLSSYETVLSDDEHVVKYYRHNITARLIYSIF